MLTVRTGDESVVKMLSLLRRFPDGAGGDDLMAKGIVLLAGREATCLSSGS